MDHKMDIENNKKMRMMKFLVTDQPSTYHFIFKCLPMKKVKVTLESFYVKAKSSTLIETWMTQADKCVAKQCHMVSL